MQKGFLKGVHVPVIRNICSLLERVRYDAYVEAVFHAGKGTLWDKETGWTFPAEPTLPDIEKILAAKNPLRITKTVQSVFHGNKDLVAFLHEKHIKEVHIVGVDTNDCVFATALDSFGAGFYTYVIEECTASSSGETIRAEAIDLLRNIDITNHSKLIAEKELVALD